MPIYLLFVTLSLNVLVLNQLYLFYKKKKDLNSTVVFSGVLTCDSTSQCTRL